MIHIHDLTFYYREGEFRLKMPEFSIARSEKVPGNNQWTELKGILKDHPAKWMIWEGKPMRTSVDKLKSTGLSSLVFDPCGNVPNQGDFLSVMQQNVENLKAAFR